MSHHASEPAPAPCLRAVSLPRFCFVAHTDKRECTPPTTSALARWKLSEIRQLRQTCSLRSRPNSFHIAPAPFVWRSRQTLGFEAPLSSQHRWPVGSSPYTP